MQLIGLFVNEFFIQKFSLLAETQKAQNRTLIKLAEQNLRARHKLV